MRTIHKYPLNKGIGNVQTLDLPNHSQILDIAFQGKDLFVWVLFDKLDDQKCTRKIVGYGTGWDITKDYNDLSHIKTIHTPGGFVWHYFEIWDD